MGTRKRNHGSKSHQNGDTDKRNEGQKSSGERSYEVPLLIVCFLVLGVCTSGIVYAYLYMGVDQAINSLIYGTSVEPTLWSAHEEEIKSVPKQQSQTSGATSKNSGYSKSDITCPSDSKIREELDAADSLLEQKKAEAALKKFTSILTRYPKSPRALYGKARSLDTLSEVKQSNQLLEQSIEEYKAVVELQDTPKELAHQAAQRGADRMTFRGWMVKAAKLLMKYAVLYPEEYLTYNDVGVKYLMAGRNNEGRAMFEKVLAHEPDNPFAMVHMGFIIKSHDNEMEKAISYLQRAIDTEAPGTIDGRFYFHLGDAYNRIGEKEKAYSVYRKGAELGLFMSYWQRSLYNVEGLKAQPWWTKQETGNTQMLKLLEDNWETIRDEGLANFDSKSGVFLREEENLIDTGEWHQFTLYQRGRRNDAACKKAPKTCALLANFADATSCTRGQIKYSVMQPGVHVWPHCGPTNCRIRAHLGLVVPDGVRIRVTDDIRTWEEGKFIIFDDSFEHEVWHEGKSVRLVLIVDMWHPEITPQQRRTLSPI